MYFYEVSCQFTAGIESHIYYNIIFIWAHMEQEIKIQFSEREKV